MSAINSLYLAFSKGLVREVEKSRKEPLEYQEQWFKKLVANGAESLFGKEHGFGGIKGIRDFRENVPVRDYNAFVPYIERLRRGENYILWNQKVKWFAKSSGTSSDKSKFIPTTPDALYTCHYGGFRRMLSFYVASNRDSRIFNGKALTLGGSVQIDNLGHGGSFNGDLSAILLKNSPLIVEMLRTPSRKTALMADFNRKIEAICRESSRQNVTNFSGVPSWNLVLMNRILEHTGKKNLLEVWPNLELFMHGGIGFEPYREIYRALIPSEKMHYLENYNASEGYFAFQDDAAEKSMLLTVNNGIFYEFIPMDIFDSVMEGRIKEIPTLAEVKKGVKYAIVISTCGGLWRYLIGDCVEFTSLFPHRIKIVGRTQLFINAFGEELMISNAEAALAATCMECSCTVTDFTAAPVFMSLAENRDGSFAKKGYHRWAIEFAEEPKDPELFASLLDKHLTETNSDYEAKRAGNATMERLQVVPLRRGTFLKWMESKNKLGGQNKVPRLYGNLKFIDELTAL